MPRLRYLDVEYEALTGETVLEALLRQGAQVPYSCRRGSCHTCALHCSEGQVEHGRAFGVAPDERALEILRTDADGKTSDIKFGIAGANSS